MGSSGSKPRKGRKQSHLPKVGSPANQTWEREGHKSRAFGSPGLRIVVVALVVLALIALAFASV